MSRLRLPDGVEIAYDDVGRGAAVILLHGWGTSRRVWDGQVADLAAEFRFLAYDSRGCGDSDRPYDEYSIAQGARDVLMLADTLKIERFSLVGSSLGGNIALETAVQAPGRIERLVLVDAPLHWFADGLPRAELDGWLNRLRGDRFATVEATAPNWFGPNGTPALVRWTIDQVLRSSWRIDHLIADAADHDPRPAMRALTASTTLLHGALDPEVPLAVAQEAVRLIPGAELHVFEHAAHMPHLEQSTSFNARLRAILRGQV